MSSLSANSAGVLVLTKLAEITGSEKYRERAGSIIRLFPAEAEANPVSFAFFLSALDLFLGPSFQVVVAGGTEDPQTQSMIRELRRRYLPNLSVVFRSLEPGAEITRIAPFTASQGLVNEQGNRVRVHGLVMRAADE